MPEDLKHINTTKETNITCFESLSFLWKSLKSPSWSALKQLIIKIIRQSIREKVSTGLKLDIDFHSKLTSNMPCIDLPGTGYRI
jgi:hypothetical protein